MDPTMVLTLSIINLIVVLFIVVSMLAIANSVDKSKTEKDNLPDTTGFETQKEKSQLAEKSDLQKLADSFARLEQRMQPLVDLTIKHERKISGIQAKGALGERIVAEKLYDLPHEWYARDVSFPNGAKVEFALRTPDKRWIPIDSQFTATELVEKLEQTTDDSQRTALRMQIRQEVRSYIGSADKYLDPGSTLGFCIVAVPTSVFDVCLEIHPELVGRNIVLISHSLLVPYILLLYNFYLKDSQSTQALEISHILSRSASQIELIKKYINSKVSPSIDSVKLQQNQYGEHSLKLHDIYSRLNEIQGDLDGVRKMVNPPLNKDVDSITTILQSSLTKVREDLLKGVERLNGHKAQSANQ